MALTRPRPRRPVARSTDAPGLSVRRAAVALLDGVFSQGRMLEDARALTKGAERAEARSLVDLTLRRLGQIDKVLTGFVHRPPAGTSRQILRLMAAELLFNATPPHAAVDMAVRLAQSNRSTGRLAGLINAVGRRLAEQGAEIVATQDASGLNTPAWFSRKLTKDWGADRARAIAEAHLCAAPHDLTAKTAGDVSLLARETGGRVLPSGSLRLPGRPQISALPGYAQGAWWVQDAAAALPARLLRAGEGMRVLDLCAAPGGKTLQLAAAGADVVAVDMSETRAERLAQNLERTELAAEILVVDALEWTPEAPFDAILLDAPCSATGTVRRHPDLPYRTDGNYAALISLQRQMLSRAAGWLKPGGALVYCTCSVFKAEGEAQAKWLVAEVPDLSPDPITREDAIPTAFVTDEGWMRTLPDLWSDQGGIDGFFAARFRRSP